MEESQWCSLALVLATLLFPPELNELSRHTR
jgi:hypothetical protein